MLTTNDTPQFIIGDKYRLRQILLNLISNSVKFCEHGSVEITCKAEPIDPERILLKCSIKDTGIGIPQDKIPNLFKPFMQLDSSLSKKYAGTGLGLVISKQLVELMGGKIWVTSQIGVGSTFFFTVVMSVCNDSPMKHSKDVKNCNALAMPLPSINILVAEDNVINQVSESINNS
jgi:signal transduction histidine kinase